MRARRLIVLVFVGALGAALAWSLFAPRSADSKGPVVRAPAELHPGDCESGSRPRLGTGPRMERVYRDVEVLVIGCAALASGRRVLVAAEPDANGSERDAGMTCFYAAAEGRWDADPRCLEVDPDCCPGTEHPFWGHGGISITSAVRHASGGSVYVTGQASAAIAAVVVRYRMPSGEIRESGAELLPVTPALSRRIGAAKPFTYFVGEVPAGADACGGVAIEGRDQGARAVDRRPLERFDRAYPSAPLALPGTSPCRGRDPLRDAIAEILWLPLSGWRSLPLLGPTQVAELLQVGHSTLRRLSGSGYLVPIRLGRRGKYVWYEPDDVELLCSLRRGCQP